MFHLIGRPEVQGSQIEVAAHQQHMHVRIHLHRVGQIRRHIGVGAGPSTTRAAVLHVPVEAGFAGALLIGHLTAKVQRFMGIGVLRRKDRALNGFSKGIVVGFLAEWIHGRALIARVEATRGNVAAILQELRELAAGNAQVALDPRGRGHAGVAFQLGGNRGLLCGVQVGTLQQGRGVVAQRKLLHLMDPGLQLRRLIGYFVVEPRCCRITRQREKEAVVGARIAIGAVGRVIETQDLR